MSSHSEALGGGSTVETSSADGPGLKLGAISFLSNVVIGVASTAPGYSLAATLGFVTAVVGFQAPAIMIVAFLPMLCIALAYNYMNRADPDCGTTFSWVTKAMGPALGLDGRLGDHRRGRDRDGEPVADRGPLHVPAVRQRQPDARSGSRSSASSGSS